MHCLVHKENDILFRRAGGAAADLIVRAGRLSTNPCPNRGSPGPCCLGQAAAGAGPLDKRAERLVKLAIAVGGGRAGAVHLHVRRALGAGLTREEIRHVTFLAITTVG